MLAHPVNARRPNIGSITKTFLFGWGRRRLLKSDRPRITPRIAESVVLTLRISLLLYAGCPSDDFATYSKTVVKAVAGAVPPMELPRILMSTPRFAEVD